MIEVINKEFNRLTGDVRQFESVRAIHDNRDDQVLRALNWLRMRQHPAGYWGEQCMLDTQLSLLSLGMWSREVREWPLQEENIGGVEVAFSWLDQFQVDSAWDNNVWDTSAILQAAATFNMLDKLPIQKAKSWMESRLSDRWGLDHGDGPHYISQALIAMQACKSPPEVIAAARQALYEVAQERCQREEFTPYIDGQIVSALILGGVNPADEHIALISSRLMDFLLKADVTISNWLHLCSAFRGLGLAVGSSSLEHPVIQQSIQRLFSPNRIRDDGSWYRDVTMTGWALIAMDSITTVRKIDGYSYQVFNSIERTRRNLVQDAKSERRRRIALVTSGMSLPILGGVTAFLIFTAVSEASDPLHDTNLLFFLIPIMVGFLGFVVRQLLRAVR